MSDSFTINDDSVQTDNSSNLSFMEYLFFYSEQTLEDLLCNGLYTVTLKHIEFQYVTSDVN